jgi:lysozyme
MENTWMRAAKHWLPLALLALASCEPTQQAAAPAPAAPPPTPVAPARILPPPPAEAPGIDVSHHSGAIDWAAVADQGYVFAYVKATEGIDDADPTFADHWQALWDRSIYRGAYHFFVTEDDPEEQARFFLSHVDHQPGDLAPVVDVEVLGHGSGTDLVPRLRRFLDLVEDAVGVPPIIYTDRNFWNTHFDDSFSRYPLWIAEYEVDAPTLPKGWDTWTMWQFEGDATLRGVEKNADRSRLHPEVDLRKLLIPQPAALAAPTTGSASG